MAENPRPRAHQATEQGRQDTAPVAKPLYVSVVHQAFLLGCAACNSKIAEKITPETFGDTWGVRTLAAAVLSKDAAKLAKLLLDGGAAEPDGVLMTLLRRHLACFERRQSLHAALEMTRKAREGVPLSEKEKNLTKGD